MPGVIDGVLGIATNIANEMAIGGIQHEKNVDTANINYESGERAAKNAYNRQKEFQEMYLTPEAIMNSQMEALKKHGLNKALLYGGGPSGGGGVGQVQKGDSGGAIPGRTSTGAEMTEVGLKSALIGQQLRNLKAEEENIKADTENKRVSTPNIEADTALKGGSLNKILTEIGNIKAETAGQELQNAFDTMRNSIQLDTADATVRTIKAGADAAEAAAKKMIHEMNIAKVEAGKREEVINAAIAQTKAETEAAISEAIEKISRARLNDSQRAVVKQLADAATTNAEANRKNALTAFQKMGIDAISGLLETTLESMRLSGQLQNIFAPIAGGEAGANALEILEGKLNELQ